MSLVELNIPKEFQQTGTPNIKGHLKLGHRFLNRGGKVSQINTCTSENNIDDRQ